MIQLIVNVTNGTTVIKGALLGQNARYLIIKALDKEAAGAELALERSQWQIKSMEPSYKNLTNPFAK